MALTGEKTYVGFGFGAIQAGLFLYEAFRSGNFGRLVVVEVVPEVVAEVRAAAGRYLFNIAHADRIETVRIGPVEIYNPHEEGDRERIIAALSAAEELGTAVPSVACYESAGPGSLHRVLAAGLARKIEQDGPRTVVYAAENHNTAAELLEAAVRKELPAEAEKGLREKVRFLNTVIGKMSGLVGGEEGADLATVTPRGRRAFLVEAFNRILISRVRFPEPFTRGIEVFEEKDNLLPFEEAKLFGHNAAHALGAYLGRWAGVEKMSGLRDAPGLFAFVRAAFTEESGGALCRKHRGVDRLFTEQGWREYVEDLSARMTNPFLRDTAERVGRDPRRKLGWNDRLLGTMRLALSRGIEPRRYAIGAAAALAALDSSFMDDDRPAAEYCRPLWSAAGADGADGAAGKDNDEAELRRVLERIEEGRRFLRAWRAAGFPALDAFFQPAG